MLIKIKLNIVLTNNLAAKYPHGESFIEATNFSLPTKLNNDAKNNKTIANNDNKILIIRNIILFPFTSLKILFNAFYAKT